MTSVLFIVLASVLSAAPIVLRDDLGRDIALLAPPQRIATTSPAVVELLMMLGVRPVLRPDIPGEPVAPPQAAAIPAMSLSHSSGPNMEQLALANPDFVILSPSFAGFADAVTATLGAPAMVLSITSPDAVLDKTILLGRITGREEAAAQLTAGMRARIEAARADLPARGPTVFALLGSPDAFYGFLPASYLGSQVEYLGGCLITANEQAAPGARGVAPFSLERVVAANPDVILIVQHGQADNVKEALAVMPAWNSLRAVRQARVHVLSHWDFLLNPGPRVTETLHTLRELLYPVKTGAAPR